MMPFTTRISWLGQSKIHSVRGFPEYEATASCSSRRSSLRILLMVRFMYSSTLPSRETGVLNSIVSVPTHEIMAIPLGRGPEASSLSSCSFSIAWKHFDMWICTFAGLFPLDRMSRRSAVEVK